MRLVAGSALLFSAAAALSGDLAIGSSAPAVIQSGLGGLLLAGLWTPVAGALVAVIALASLFTEPRDPWMHILMATLGTALALLGPGAWSIDARLFGWRRINIRDRP